MAFVVLWRSAAVDSGVAGTDATLLLHVVNVRTEAMGNSLQQVSDIDSCSALHRR
jgi:hypothetical protein